VIVSKHAVNSQYLQSTGKNLICHGKIK